MTRSVSNDAARIVILLTVTGLATPAVGQPLFTKDLCAVGQGNVGTNWVSLPMHTNMMTAEDLCAAIPLAITVAQGVNDTPNPSRRWVYDCATGICTSPTEPIPEPGCAASTCFCLERGEGVEVRPSAATTWDIERCDTFETITLPPGYRAYLLSIPYDTFLVTANDLAAHIDLPRTGGALVPKGTVTRVDCATGTVAVCTAGTTSCDTMLLASGEAYRVIYPSPSGGVAFVNPVDCSPDLSADPASCPIGDLAFVDQVAFGWTAPPGCPLRLLYDTIRGDLGCLRKSCVQGLPLLAPPCAGCLLLEDDDIDTAAGDTDLPAVGSGFWYHSRVEGGTWNATGPMLCSDLDQVLGIGCP